MSVNRQPNGKWMFRCYVKTDGVNKQYNRKGFSTKAEAREQERIFIATFNKNKNVKLTINEAINSYKLHLAKRYKNSTIESKSYILDEIGVFFQNRLIEKISAADISLFQDTQMQKKISNARINKKIQVFRDLLKYANDFLNIENSSYLKIVNLKVEYSKRVDKHIEECVFNQFLATFDDIETKILFEIMYKAGLRIAEVQALKWQDIDFEKRIISVTKQYFSTIGGWTLEQPKSISSIREVDICSSLLHDLQELYNIKCKYFAENKNITLCNLFVIRDVKPIPDQTVNNIRRKHCAMIGTYFDNHSCRHSYGSNLIAKGFDLKYVSEQMGHESLGVTLKVYHHLLNDVRIENKKKLENL